MASVAAGPLMIAASGTAIAQSSPPGPSAADAYAKGPKGPVPVAPLPVVWSNWSGLYGGVSFGATSIGGTASTASHSVTNQTSVSAANTVQQSTSITDTLSSGSGRSWGGQADIYLGYNFRLGTNWILGAQVEGTVANNFVQLDASQLSLNNRTTVTTPVGGVGTTTTSQTTTTFGFVDGLAERWAVSALARAGWLFDPRNLVYVTGGYTYGGFEWGTRTFGLNGATVGGGWEHQIAPAWTLKAEYRYTRFEDKDFVGSSSSTTNTRTVSAAGAVSTTASTNTTTSTDRLAGLDLHTLRFGITHYFGSDPSAVVTPVVPLITKGPAPVAWPTSWTGLYGGVSFGAASLHATTSTLTHSVTNETNTFGAITQTVATIADGLRTGSGRDWGGLADIYLGYNVRLGSNWILGAQVEGTVANNQATIDASQVSLSNRATTNTPPGTTSTVSTLSTATSTTALAERWAVSVLARAGWLIDPRDLVYVIGGYTYGGFEWSSRVFGLNGATIGGGWEHQIAPSWTLKAEYRYTRFENKDLVQPSVAADASTTLSPGATSTSASTTTFTDTSRVSGLDQHSLRVGLTHYFGSDALAAAPGATAMVVKAPPPVARPSWAGPYGGVSFGLTSMHVATDSTFDSVFNIVQTDTGIRADDVQTSNAAFSTRGRKTGAMADIFVGYNVAWGPKVIAGVQGEGSVVQALVTGNGTSTQITNDVSVTTPPGGAAGTVTFNSVSVQSFTFSTQARWMISALGRAGWLIDPQDLIYVIGGWSYGHFTNIDRVFAMHGPTVGAGIERQVAPSWTVKAEYRYTHFLERDVPLVQPQAQNFTSGTSGFAFSGVSNETDRIAVNMHTVRFGLSRYFSSR